MVEHGEEEVAHGRGFEAAELAGGERAAAVAGEDEGEVVVGVAVAVGVAAAIDDHGIVQHGGAVGVFGGVEFLLVSEVRAWERTLRGSCASVVGRQAQRLRPTAAQRSFRQPACVPIVSLWTRGGMRGNAIHQPALWLRQSLNCFKIGWDSWHGTG